MKNNELIMTVEVVVVVVITGDDCVEKYNMELSASC